MESDNRSSLGALAFALAAHHTTRPATSRPRRPEVAPGHRCGPWLGGPRRGLRTDDQEPVKSHSQRRLRGVQTRDPTPRNPYADRIASRKHQDHRCSPDGVLCDHDPVPFAKSLLSRKSGNPHLVASLRRLAAEVDARWPDRATFADGWVGDAAHAARQSDHNPDRMGRVHALDITADGIDPHTLVRAARQHPSTAYVIWSRTIWSVSSGMAGQPYSGSNPHLTHVHISAQHSDVGRHNTTRWLRG